jgi:hypothetical protein
VTQEQEGQTQQKRRLLTWTVLLHVPVGICCWNPGNVVAAHDACPVLDDVHHIWYEIGVWYVALTGVTNDAMAIRSRFGGTVYLHDGKGEDGERGEDGVCVCVCLCVVRVCVCVYVCVRVVAVVMISIFP